MKFYVGKESVKFFCRPIA